MGKKKGYLGLARVGQKEWDNPILSGILLYKIKFVHVGHWFSPFNYCWEQRLRFAIRQLDN